VERVVEPVDTDCVIVIGLALTPAHNASDTAAKSSFLISPPFVFFWKRSRVRILVGYDGRVREASHKKRSARTCSESIEAMCPRMKGSIM
jgi:hypothetical protein